MKINKIISQNRRDFRALYECEGCGHLKEDKGYDDSYFHEEVIPKMKCPACGKNSTECGAEYRPLKTKYPDGVQV